MFHLHFDYFNFIIFIFCLIILFFFNLKLNDKIEEYNKNILLKIQERKSEIENIKSQIERIGEDSIMKEGRISQLRILLGQIKESQNKKLKEIANKLEEDLSKSLQKYEENFLKLNLSKKEMSDLEELIKEKLITK
jgi:MinD-like ATPase involved in chromosome partitioning or flagellar assembly